jgi:hypothetical protein
MRWRSLSFPIIACAIASSVLSAKAGPASGPWAHFDDAGSQAAVRAIIASEIPGDATLSSLSVEDGRLIVTGVLGLDNGSRWSTLGAEIAPVNATAGADMSAASVLRIRLASAVARPLRVRIKGGDREIANAGCYPVVVQMVTDAPADYAIPLSAFRSPGWCNSRAVSIEQTLRSVQRVEVTANDEPVGPVAFSVGRIDFLADDWNEPDRSWRLAWSDAFDGERGQAATPAVWRVDKASERGVALDGLGHLRLRTGSDNALDSGAVSIRSSPQLPITHGRTEVRLQAPELATGDRQASVRVALHAPSAGSPAIVLLEGSANAEGFAVGLDGLGPQQAAFRMRTRMTNPLKGHFFTIACDWDSDRIRWLVDGMVVQETGRGELAPAAWAALERAPLMLEISVDGTYGGRAVANSATLLIDSVRFWRYPAQTDTLASASTAAPKGTSGSSSPASTALAATTTPRRRTASAGPSAAASAAAPSQRVVCEHSARYELMLCH